jgi:hypothetical protein
VGAAYARLALDRKPPPRKSLLRLTQGLVEAFAEVQWEGGDGTDEHAHGHGDQPKTARRRRRR